MDASQTTEENRKLKLILNTGERKRQYVYEARPGYCKKGATREDEMLLEI